MLLLISHLSATSVVRQPAAASRCAAARLQLSPSEPESTFRAWLESQGPADASLPIVSSGATTAEGALRDIWQAVLGAADASAPPVSVLLLPDCAWLERWERMEALDAHLRSCRPSCSLLGSTVRLQALHPGSQPTSPDESPLEVERRRAPLPAFTLSRPSALRPAGFDGLPPEERPAGPGGAADEEEAEAAQLWEQLQQRVAAKRELRRKIAALRRLELAWESQRPSFEQLSGLSRAEGVHAVMDKAARLKRVLGGLGGARDGGALMAKGGCGGGAPRHHEAIRTVSLSDLRQLSTALCS
mmetsp:Transcript_45680/g.140817  ORF Transcript_45680/g.140817 Transcript_45680/m.140817 type:complete len:301 (+) Transcript_45680:129-1031(+)